MKLKYNWAVWVNNKIAGYVRSESEFEALRIAQEKIAKNKSFFLERTYLGNPIPVEESFCLAVELKNDNFNW